MKDVFCSALEREPAQRAAFLDRACDGDQSLRREVESLLASHEQAASFMETPVIEAAAQVCGEAPRESLVEQRVGQYEVLSELGKGGMGVVYLARDAKLDRKVALKLLPAYFMEDRERVRRFEREARAASALNHPNILTIYEVGQSDGQHFIATEFVEGQTLRQHAAGALLKIGEVIDIVLQAAGALAAAHAAGIVHRDIKPENVMVRPDGYVKVLDFGLAKLTQRRTAPVASEGTTRIVFKTEPGVVMGTVSYMSPEQARGLEVDERTDIWSLGVVLYELLAGHAPFEGATTGDVLVAVLDREPTPLAQWREVPADLERVVCQALSKEREERYQTVQELSADLKRLKQRLEFEAGLGRYAPSEDGDPSGAPSSAYTIIDPVGRPTHESGDGRETRAPRIAEYLLAQVSRRRRTAVLVLLGLVLTAASVVYILQFARGRQAIDSVAVLPLVNVSADPDAEYLSDGVTESLINSLSQLPGLRVMSRDSVFRLKGRDLDAQTAGRELGVRALLMGRVVQRGDGLSISVELVDTHDNSHIWGEQYSRRLADILAVQEDISKSVTERLRLKLSGKDKERLAKRYTENTEAYQLYMRGRYFWDKRPGDVDVLEKAIRSFNQAIEMDPNYALAYAGLGDAYLFSAASLGRKETMARARAAAKKALEIDDTLAEAHTTLGFVKMNFDFDWPGAEQEFKRALELNPNYATAHQFYGAYLIQSGRSNEEGMRELRRALEIDPLSLALNWHAGSMLYYTRQYDEAIEQFQKTLQLDPNHSLSRVGLAQAYLQKGKLAEAIRILEEVTTARPKAAESRPGLAYAYAATGKRAKAQELTNLIETSAQGNVTYHLARIYTALGKTDQALRWLEKAYDERAFNMFFLGVEPAFDSLRSDARFEALLRRVGLEN
ncbi:MAG TPA: protein kinase [Blastocatellia bacterium]|nr:protein kinase [Blastocatellia bacterium]